MIYSKSYEDSEMTEIIAKPKISQMQRSRHLRFLSETLSTDCCTFEIERPSWQTSASNLFDEKHQYSKKKILRKTIFELPERLSSLKQITENKIKFLKLEKEMQELEQCTFKPKTNVKGVKSSCLHFSKKLLEHPKAKNTEILKLYLQKTPQNNSKNIKIKKSDVTVHERLYNQSKIFLRQNKPSY